MTKTLTFFLLTALFSAPSLGAADLLPFLVAEMEVERQLLSEDLRLLAIARQEQSDALSRFTAAISAIDERIDSRQVNVEGLEALEREALETQLTLDHVNERAAAVRRQIHQRLRKTALLESRIEGLGDQPGSRNDPFSGNWTLSVSPGNQDGFLQLRFSNNEVTGFYTLKEGGSGSLTGTYDGSRLTLQRVDSREGGGSTWVGELDPVLRQIRGTWTSGKTADSSPTSGTWSAEKIDTISNGSQTP